MFRPSRGPIEEDDVDVNEAFEMLASERRRLVLEHLLERRDHVPVTELVDDVAAAEANGHEPVDEFRNEVHVSLHHNHLPKLSSSNLIEYDAERGVVTVTEAAHGVEAYLESTRDDGHHV